MRNRVVLIFLLFSGMFFSGCVLKKNNTYFQDLKATKDTIPQKVIDSNLNLVIIQPYDQLDIKIKNADKALEFITESQTTGSNNSLTPLTPTNLSQQNYTSSYTVDNKGNVTLPELGEVNLKGLTLKMARQKLAEQMKKFITRPYVEIKFLSFKITVLGEVVKPGIVTISNEKADVIYALAEVGDINEFGDKQNIKIIRGDLRNPSVFLIDLTNSKSFNSKGYILQPNDIVYVGPTSRRYFFANLNELLPILTIINTLFLVYTIIKTKP